MKGLYDLVVLVPDLAHQLLQNILQGHDPLGAAVLVHHHDHMVLAGLKNPHQVGNFRPRRGTDHLAVDGGEVGQPPVAGGIEVLFMYDADDGVNGLPVYRQAGIPRLNKADGQLLGGDILGNSLDIHPGGEDLPHLQIVKLNGGADELALVGVQAALVLRLLHHGGDLLVGNAAVLRGLKQLGHSVFQLSKEKC